MLQYKSKNLYYDEYYDTVSVEVYVESTVRLHGMVFKQAQK
jgi:hypothetical protein